MQCVVTYNSGPFQCQDTVWNLLCTGRGFSGDLPMRPGETLSLTVTLPNEQRIQVPEAVVRGLTSELGYPVLTPPPSAFIANFPLPTYICTFTSLASSNTYLSFRRCIVNLEMSGGAPQSFPMSPPCACTHSRLISDCVSEEEHQAGKVRCVECGDIVPDPHLQREAKAT